MSEWEGKWKEIVGEAIKYLSFYDPYDSDPELVGDAPEFYGAISGADARMKALEKVVEAAENCCDPAMPETAGDWQMVPKWAWKELRAALAALKKEG